MMVQLDVDLPQTSGLIGFVLVELDLIRTCHQAFSPAQVLTNSQHCERQNRLQSLAPSEFPTIQGHTIVISINQ